jgi:hypothetical protein
VKQLTAGMEMQHENAAAGLPMATVRVDELRTEGTARVIQMSVNVDRSENTGCAWYADGVGTDPLVRLDDEMRAKAQQAAGRPSGILAVPVTELPRTRGFVVVMRCLPEADLWMLDTVFPGSYAPPFPAQGQPEADRQRYADFWKEHAFAVSSEGLKASVS